MSNEFATSGGHWYDSDGNPAYTQPNKSKPGEARPTTLRDAKKLDLVPSVTGILGVADKPALNRWKLRELMKAALTIPALPDESGSDYESRLWEASNEKSKTSRDKGTEIHGYIESFFESGANADNPYVDAVSQLLCSEFGSQEWRSEKSFSSTLGYGRKVDLYSDKVIIDYKTKDLCKMDMKRSMTYLENKMQLSAYRKGLNQPTAKIANVYIGRELQEDGTALVKLEIHDDDKWKEFECLLNYWKLIKGIE